MKLTSTQDAAKRIQNSSSVGELDLKSAANVEAAYRIETANALRRTRLREVISLL